MDIIPHTSPTLSIILIIAKYYLDDTTELPYGIIQYDTIFHSKRLTHSAKLDY